jgi:hypothetical protein
LNYTRECGDFTQVTVNTQINSVFTVKNSAAYTVKNSAAYTVKNSAAYTVKNTV